MSDCATPITKEKEKNVKALEEMNTDLESKDKQITEMENSIVDLNDWFHRLSLELDEVKSIIVYVFQLGFHNFVWQSKHFFVDKELNFDLLDSSRFLEDIISDNT